MFLDEVRLRSAKAGRGRESIWAIFRSPEGFASSEFDQIVHLLRCVYEGMGGGRLRSTKFAIGFGAFLGRNDGFGG